MPSLCDGCRSYVKRFSLVAVIRLESLAEAGHTARGTDDLDTVRGLGRDGERGPRGGGCRRRLEELPDTAGEIPFEQRSASLRDLPSACLRSR